MDDKIFNENGTQLVLLPKSTETKDTVKCDCSSCKYGLKCHICDTMPDTYYKFKCNKGGKIRLIYLDDVEKGKDAPKWCPLDEKNNAKCDEVLEKKKEKIKGVKGVMDWDDIRISSKYHIPPVLGYKRADILIRYKSVDYVSYSEVSEPNVFRVLYKDDPRVKFISEL